MKYVCQILAIAMVLIMPLTADDVLSIEELKKITPKQALTFLKEGNQRFLANKDENRDDRALSQYYAKHGQQPFAVVLSCIDSRSVAELVFDQGIGDLFTLRVAGNVISDDMLASMEYATKFVGSRLLVVMGHTQCGAVQAACKHITEGHIGGLIKMILPAVNAMEERMKTKDCTDEKLINAIAKQNVLNMLKLIPEQSTIIRKLIDSGDVLLVGALNNISTGVVTFFDPSGKPQ